MLVAETSQYLVKPLRLNHILLVLDLIAVILINVRFLERIMKLETVRIVARKLDALGVCVSACVVR